jgi:hypothetical protein
VRADCEREQRGGGELGFLSRRSRLWSVCSPWLWRVPLISLDFLVLGGDVRSVSRLLVGACGRRGGGSFAVVSVLVLFRQVLLVPSSTPPSPWAAAFPSCSMPNFCSQDHEGHAQVEGMLVPRFELSFATPVLL